MFYKTLFNVNIHHGYFLDSGEKKFLPALVDDTLLSGEEKENALENYSINDYIKIIPSASTRSLFKNHRILLRSNKQGFSLLISAFEDGGKYTPLIFLNDTSTFTFEIQATDPYFYNYTELKNTNESRLYLFSNQLPNGQSTGFENIFDNNGGPIDNRFLLSTEASQDLLRTISEEDVALNTSMNQFSLAYIIKLIEDDGNLTQQEKTDQVSKLLIANIQARIKSHTIGYLRLSAKGDGTSHILEFDSSVPSDLKQYTLSTTPTFTISFINKKTFWRYISLSDGVKLTTNSQKWSTKNGFIEIKTDDFDASGLEPPATDPDDYVFPNPRVTSVKKEGNDYYSEIFI
ncbi:hypothetical protein [Mariniflexile sp. AS56]|uniref:hypothetical protein n=1 Tax=Mariniflexile sp. AS56 TaxID=3063957 RepID=UPI0026EF3C2C|nr:hypothetical protein [Mariniflexile sp. AS56]MDO7174069.1 hypothetical protein [Mariniflexile sp. AS56]